jgi:hypothetical protein
MVVGEEREKKTAVSKFDIVLKIRTIMRASMRTSMTAGSSDVEELQSLLR